TGSIRNSAFGLDAIVVKVDPNQEGSLVAGTEFGGSGDDVGNRIAVDTAGKVYVTGVTMSSNFPTTPGAFQTNRNGTQDAFVTKLDDAIDDVTGYQFVLYSTYLGGNGAESGLGIALGSSTNSPVVVTGTTNSSDFPITAGGFQPTYGGGV